MSFEEKFSLFINWCDRNKDRSIHNPEQFWSNVVSMMHEISIEFDEYEEYSDMIVSYVLYLEKYYKKLIKNLKNT